MGFSVDASGYWGARVTYGIYHVVPSLVVNYPVNGGYVNTPNVTVWGNFDGWAGQIQVSLDNVTFTTVAGSEAEWHTQMHLMPGTNTIYTRSIYTWGDFYATYTVFNPVIVTLDVTPPTVTVTAPSPNSKVRSSYAEIAWQSSDNFGIAKTELWNGEAWIKVQGNSYKMWVAPGVHQVLVRVTDMAGNQATSPVTFRSDSRAMSFNGPYYGLPIIAIVVGVTLAGIFVALTALKRRRARAAPPSQPPAAPPPVTPPGTQ